MNARKTMKSPDWLNVLNEEKIEVEPFTQTKQEVIGEDKKPDNWHIAESRNWKDSSKAELSTPFSFRIRKDLEELLKKHTKGSKNQVINDLIEEGLKSLESKFNAMRK